jgi:hypothetical protein
VRRDRDGNVIDEVEQAKVEEDEGSSSESEDMADLENEARM